MRIMEARFHGTTAKHRPIRVARVFCDGARVRVESLLDHIDAGDATGGIDGLLSKLRYLVESSGSTPFEHLKALQSAYWSFTEVHGPLPARAGDEGSRHVFERLTIVLPMWNEEENIRSSVDAAMEVCDELVGERVIGDYQIVIVDDCSTDATAPIADELAAHIPNVDVVHHDRNRKLGGAMKTGFAAASGDVVLYTDADLPCDFAEVRRALRMMRIYNADIVSAYRNHRTGEGPLRAFYSFGYNWLIRLCFGLVVRDVNFAFKLFRRHILEQVRLESEGSFIDAELLVKAQRLGYRIVQFGADYVPRIRGTSTLAQPAIIAKLLWELVRSYGRIRQLRPLDTARLIEMRKTPPPVPVTAMRRVAR
jgi:GT2 family glycosyltransferase